MKKGMDLADCYKIDVAGAHCHDEGNWYWNLSGFPGAYFDADECVVFLTEEDYFGCVYLAIGPRNTGVRNKSVGMSIKDIPGYKKLDPPPISI